MQHTFAIVGATAVGKSELALDLAEHVGGEIVNADSMQLYRGMDIGTAKLPLSQRRGIPHHMIDVLDVTQTASAAAFQQQARDVIAAIHSRGRSAVLVGGTGLFVDAVLDDLQFPPSNAQVRARLEDELEALGSAVMYERLRAHAPAAAANILPTNGRRIVRALEVVEITGAPPVTTLGRLPEVIPATRIGLRRDRDELDVRIEQRVAQMWQDGLIQEVRSLVAQGLRDGRTASKALGYQQLLATLDGQVTVEQARQETVAATRRYARRQESWFRRDERIVWFDAAVESMDIWRHIGL